VTIKANQFWAERRHVENNHHKGKEPHSHRESDQDVHSANADQPDAACLIVPNKKWIARFK